MVILSSDTLGCCGSFYCYLLILLGSRRLKSQRHLTSKSVLKASDCDKIKEFKEPSPRMAKERDGLTTSAPSPLVPLATSQLLPAVVLSLLTTVPSADLLQVAVVFMLFSC